jgi:anti-sigma factor RsiW
MEALTCQELVELVTDYLEGALPASERARFDAHVAECEGCGLYLEQMLTTIRLMGGLDERPDVEGLLRAFRDWKRV